MLIGFGSVVDLCYLIVDFSLFSSLMCCVYVLLVFIMCCWCLCVAVVGVDAFCYKAHKEASFVYG